MKNNKINIQINKPYLPAFDKYRKYLETMYANQWVTNNGPLLQEFSVRLKEYLDVPYLVLTASGTTALQLAYNLFDLKGNTITSPFSFIATCNSIDWVGLKVKFSDIDANSLNIDPSLIESQIDVNTSAIVPVHAYGNPCDTNSIKDIANKHKLRVIYDAAHAFGVKKNGKSILREGDASAISLHATKLFHCIEGGALILNNADDHRRASNMINFGIDNSSSEMTSRGFNGKLSEAHAAMGLAMLDDIDHVMSRRLEHYFTYKKLLCDSVMYPQWDELANQNAAYMPIVLKDFHQMDKIHKHLMTEGIEARRYFYPALNSLEHLRVENEHACPVARSLAQRVLCLPIYYSLESSQIKNICNIILKALKNTDPTLLNS